MAGRPPAGVPLVPGLPRRVIKVIHCAEANIPRTKFEPVSVSHNQVNIGKSMQVFTDQLHTQGFGVCPRGFPASRWIALQLHNAPLPWTEAARL